MSGRIVESLATVALFVSRGLPRLLFGAIALPCGVVLVALGVYIYFTDGQYWKGGLLVVFAGAVIGMAGVLVLLNRPSRPTTTSGIALAKARAAHAEAARQNRRA